MPHLAGAWRGGEQGLPWWPVVWVFLPEDKGAQQAQSVACVVCLLLGPSCSTDLCGASLGPARHPCWGHPGAADGHHPHLKELLDMDITKPNSV